MSFKNFTPCERKLDFITLRTRTPHGRTLTFIEHPELQSGCIRHKAGIASESIYLLDYLTFSYTSNSRIATHSRISAHVHRNKKDVAAKVCSGHSSLTAGVATTNNYDIISEFHYLAIPQTTGRIER